MNPKFVVFLKATLCKMVATNALPMEFIDLHFWESWPEQYYTLKSFVDVSQKVDMNTTMEEEEEEKEEEDYQTGNLTSPKSVKYMCDKTFFPIIRNIY